MARRAFEIQVIEAPVLDDLLLGTNLQEGQIVNIYCNVRTGDLPIHFEWLKDGKRIPSALKVLCYVSFLGLWRKRLYHINLWRFC